MSERRYWHRINLNHTNEYAIAGGKTGFQNASLLRKCIAEFFGTFVFVLVIISTNLQSALYKDGLSFASITIGIALFLAIMIAGPISGGHFNPAITLSVAITHWEEIPRDFGVPRWQAALHRILAVLAYMGTQTLATFLAAGLAYLEYYDSIWALPASERTQVYKCFAAYPAKDVGTIGAVVQEIIATSVLLIVVYMATDKTRATLTGDTTNGAIIVGLGLASILGCMADQTSASLNPARDLGARFMAATIFQDNEIWEFPADNIHDAGKQYWWIPIVAPFIGGILGGLFYISLVEAHWLPKEKD